MISSNLVVSVLLAASAFVQASPFEPRNDDFVPGFLDAVKKCGLNTLSGLYADFFKTKDGQDYVNELQYQKLSLLAPEDCAFNPDHPSIGYDPTTIFRYLSIKGDIVSKKRQQPSQSRDVAPTLMQKQSFSKRAPNPQVQVVDTVANANWKRNNDYTIFIRSTITNATLKAGCTYKDLTIFPMDILLFTPTKVDDTLCKPLVAEAPDGFKKAGQALYKTDLMDKVNYSEKVTMFVPLDSGFDGVDDISTNQLTSMVKNHIVYLNYFSTQFSSKPTVKSASGKKLTIKKEGSDTYVYSGKSKAKIIRSDVITENGAIHVIDGVLE
ncbi:Fasciclin-domain-containing protein [Ceratobasidium sp. AG-I]|nr:Fasciclin-domain-containing protein [Ceratobasidium sp. AG-I]